MRVLHFIATNFVGGPEKQILSHLDRLRRHPDYEVMLISFAEPGGEELRQRAAELGVRACLLPADKRALPQAQAELRAVYEDWRPDVICTHGYKALCMALLLRRRTGCRFVAFSRGWTTDDLRVRLYTVVDKTLVRFADRVVAVADSQRRRLEKIWVPPRKIRVINNAVTLRPEELEQEARGNVRAELSLPPRSRLLLSAGRLSSEKGQRYLIEAMPAIARQHPEAHLLLAGDGPMREELEALAARQACADRIHFLGFRRDIKDLFRQADVFVLPSLSEGLPNVVLEAMALGAPVVSTGVGGVPEVIDDGETGLLVSPRQPDALADAAAALLGDPRRAEVMSRRARQAVNERYSSERQTELLLDVYREVTG